MVDDNKVDTQLDDQQVIDQAVEQAESQGGIDMTESQDATEDANQESDSSTDQSETTEKSAPSEEDAKKEGSDEQDTPFHEHPRFREITQRNREYKDKIRELEENQQKLLGRFNQMKQPEQVDPNSGLTPEQKQAREQLIDLLGIRGVTEKIDTLSKENESLKNSQLDRMFSEVENSIESKAKDLSLDKEEMKDKIEEYIDKNPLLATSKNNPESWRLVSDLLYPTSGVAFEAGKRTANKNEIERQKKVKSGQTENTSKAGVKGSGLKLTGDALTDSVALIDQIGGEDQIDMTK